MIKQHGCTVPGSGRHSSTWQPRWDQAGTEPRVQRIDAKVAELAAAEASKGAERSSLLPALPPSPAVTALPLVLVCPSALPGRCYPFCLLQEVLPLHED